MEGNKFSFWTHIECPYCGFIQSRNILVSNISEEQIIDCSSEDGGCDNNFVISTHINLEIQIGLIQYNFDEK